MDHFSSNTYFMPPPSQIVRVDNISAKTIVGCTRVLASQFLRRLSVDYDTAIELYPSH